MIFDYPEPELARRHGPAGYTSYESFLPWLRDEFAFRCVYCLKRETWGQVTAEFEIDHFVPQCFAEQGILDYGNLVYACRRCNAVKGDLQVEDPFAVLRSRQLAALPDGMLQPVSEAALRLIDQLDLNSPRLVAWREMWMRIVILARERAPELYLQLVGLPRDLPDLQRLRPPNNGRREG